MPSERNRGLSAAEASFHIVMDILLRIGNKWFLWYIDTIKNRGTPHMTHDKSRPKASAVRLRRLPVFCIILLSFLCCFRIPGYAEPVISIPDKVCAGEVFTIGISYPQGKGTNLSYRLTLATYEKEYMRTYQALSDRGGLTVQCSPVDAAWAGQTIWVSVFICPAENQNKAIDQAADTFVLAEPAAEQKAVHDAKEEPGLWRQAYYHFIYDGLYKRSGQKYYFRSDREPFDDPLFALYDMDMNGVPELLIFNGDDTHAGNQSYAYGYADGKVQFIGNIGGHLSLHFYYPDSEEYPGLFFQDGNMGYESAVYYELKNGQVRAENVMWVEAIGDTVKYKSETKRTSLYKLCRNVKDRTSLKSYPLGEIPEDWWTVQQEPQMPDDQAVLIRPEEGEGVRLWKEGKLTVQWIGEPADVRYTVTLRCSWTDGNGKTKLRTIYEKTFSAPQLTDLQTVTLVILAEEIDRQSIPTGTDLDTWVVLDVERQEQ